MCDTCQWKRYLKDVIEMRTDSKNYWADHVLEAIEKGISQRSHVTEMHIDEMKRIENEKGLY